MRSPTKLYVTVAVGLLILLTLGVTLWAQTTPISPAAAVDISALARQAAAEGIFVGDVIDAPVTVQDFTAPSNHATINTFSDLDGSWRLVFFGYLHCPDFCPLTLVDYMRVKQLLGDDAEHVDFVYISVDAARDTPAKMATYLNAFDPAFIGFSAGDAALQRIQPDYGFYYERRLGSGSQAVYTVDHSTRSYLVDRKGVLRASFAYQTPPAAVADALRWYLSHE